MNRQTIAPLAAITAPVTGVKTKSQIVGGKRSGYFFATARVGVTLAGAVATGIRNGGSPWALVDYAGIEDQGEDTAYWTGLMWAALSNRFSFNSYAGVNYNGTSVLNSLGNGVYSLEHTICMPFAWGGPEGSGAPWETAHIQRDPRQNSYMWVQANNDVTRLVDQGGTITTALSIECTQVYDDQRVDVLPYFRPKFRLGYQAISSGVVNDPFYIKLDKPCRGLMFVPTDSNDGIVTDIITSVRLLDDADDGNYIGPSNIRWATLAGVEQFRYGGATPVLGNSAATGLPDAMTGLGCYFHNFQDGGRLSQVYNPANAGTNLRLEITGQPSVIGGGSAAVWAGIIELESINGRTAIPLRPDGRPIFTV